jgi:hypothetical protein
MMHDIKFKWIEQECEIPKKHHQNDMVNVVDHQGFKREEVG